jgi:copper chaperone NosL
MSMRLKNITRIVCIVTSLMLLYIISLPIWRIELAAPQYPEGLVLRIYAHKLAGDVQVINGLNHYIGMRTLHTEDFIEFTILPYMIGALALFGILTALINRKWFFFSWIGFLLLFGIVALVDFYRWNYNYGHNLDPEAPIQVPGMSYQPPLLGYKQLLNFGAYSLPDLGGWIFLGVYLFLIAALIFELRRVKSGKSVIRSSFAITMLCLFLGSCSNTTRAIKPGLDSCESCKMTLTDQRFAAELVSSTGKIFVFDDLHCMKEYIAEHRSKLTGSSVYVVDFNSSELIPLKDAQLVKSEKAHSPMGSNTISFKDARDRDNYLQSNTGELINSNSIKP